MIRAYTARAMTGRSWAEIVLEASTDKAVLAGNRILALDPVLAEVEEIGCIPPGICGQNSKPNFLAAHWKRDKRMMRDAHILIDFSPEAKSHGIEKEVGYFRYFLFSPVVRYFRNGNPPKSSIMLFEDDLVVGNMIELVIEIDRLWGTPWKRFKWRAGVYAKYWRRGFWHKLERWFL